RSAGSSRLDSCARVDQHVCRCSGGVGDVHRAKARESRRWGTADELDEPPQMSAQALRAEVDSVRWQRRVDLGDRLVPPGGADSEKKLGRLGLPASLAGKSVLDVGAWDGFFSFEAERRGASRVLATDSYVWRGGCPTGKRGFELARRVLGSRVEDQD